MLSFECPFPVATCNRGWVVGIWKSGGLRSLPWCLSLTGISDEGAICHEWEFLYVDSYGYSTRAIFVVHLFYCYFPCMTVEIFQLTFSPLLNYAVTFFRWDIFSSFVTTFIFTVVYFSIAIIFPGKAPFGWGFLWCGICPLAAAEKINHENKSTIHSRHRYEFLNTHDSSRNGSFR